LSRYFFWLLDIIFFILWPIAKPLSAALNRFFGEELPNRFSREELSHLVEEHAQDQSSAIDADESRIVSGALAYSTLKAEDVMTPLEKVVTVDFDDEMDAALVIRLKNSGHSRFPVRNKEGKFVGLLYFKDLVGEEIPQPVTHLLRDDIFDVQASRRLDTVLSRFIQTKTHLFQVVDDDDNPIGIITLEDVIEEILKREINDEYDVES
jgi:CBS domain containing-hemolysin-like protein